MEEENEYYNDDDDDNNDNNYDDYMKEPELSNQPSSTSNDKVKILEMEEVHHDLKRAVEEVNELTALGSDWSLLLLRYFKWNFEKLQGVYFLNPDKVLQEIGYMKTTPTVDHRNRCCQVCLMVSDKILKHVCGHEYCWNCWKEHVYLSVVNKSIFVGCMAGCNSVLLNSTVELLLKDSPSTEQKYIKYLCQRFVETNKNIQFCPGLDCKFCIYSSNSGLTEVQCYCGQKFCFKCKMEVHRPCVCEDVVRWKELVMKEEANAKWLTLNTKTCPFCMRHVERSMGCNYMMCAFPGGCGKAFCYVCSKPWEPDHKDHFKCNVFKPNDKQKELEAKNKIILERINFYCEKYLTNQHSKTKIQEVGQKMPDYQVQLFNLLGIELNESEFILGAYRFAAQACDALKWSYAFRFFMNDKIEKKEVSLDLFQFLQGEFERWKENLTIKLEQKFNKLVEGLVEDRKEKRNIVVGEKREEFAVIKLDITTYYKEAESFMGKLINMAESMM